MFTKLFAAIGLYHVVKWAVANPDSVVKVSQEAQALINDARARLATQPDAPNEVATTLFIQ